MADTKDIIKEIKQSFRPMMNGVASHSMRTRGVGYKLNWGIPFVELKRMAQEYAKDYDLAINLWKEDIRECKILATLLMPADVMLPDMAELWMEQTTTQEMAEMTAFNLFQNLDYASELAFRWLAVDNELYQICAYNLLSRLFLQKMKLDARAINEYLDEVDVAMQNDNLAVRHAALNSIKNFMKLGEEYEQIAREALKSLNLSFF